MAELVPQNFANHRRFVPLFHFAGAGILLLNLLWACYRIYHAMRAGGRFDRANSIAELGVAIALVILFWYAREFPIAVQDRVIRLEMRLRLAQLLPEDLRSRIGELSRPQLVALRFASDRELPELTRKVMDERISSGDAIKRLIADWQADHLRA